MKKEENYKLKKKIEKNLKPYIKVDKEIKFDDTEIQKYKFHHHKNPFLINNININKIVVFSKVFFW